MGSFFPCFKLTIRTLNSMKSFLEDGQHLPLLQTKMRKSKSMKSFVGKVGIIFPASNSKSENWIAWTFSWKKLGSVFPCFKSKITNSNSLNIFLGKNGQHFPCCDPRNWRIECVKKYGENGQHFPCFKPQIKKSNSLKKCLEKMGRIFPILTRKFGESNAWTFLGKKWTAFSLVWPAKLENRMHETFLGQILKNKRRTVLELVAHGPDRAMMICKMFPPAAPAPFPLPSMAQTFGAFFLCQGWGRVGAEGELQGHFNLGNPRVILTLERPGGGLGSSAVQKPNPTQPLWRPASPPRMWGRTVSATFTRVGWGWVFGRLLPEQARVCYPDSALYTPLPRPPPPLLHHPAPDFRTSLLKDVRKSGVGWRRRGEGLGATIPVAGTGRVLTTSTSGEAGGGGQNPYLPKMGA